MLFAAGRAYGDAAEDKLSFDASKFTVKTFTVDGRTVTCRAYEGIAYVTNPEDATYESMNIYVPVEYYEGKSIGKYNAGTAPIFLPNTVGGYMPGKPIGPGDRMDHENAIEKALAHGYVVAVPGARGRVLRDDTGRYYGKAPACIVDLKAAVRYLRHNDKAMPGDAGKIISNGTSAGGALSALLGASGDSPDYEPYLMEIGAADERDDIFAASCYCPITNLDHADAAYEWLFCGLNSYDDHGRVGVMDERHVKVSVELKALFPSYVNGLGLKAKDGTVLHLDASGDGSFKDYVKSYVIASAQKALQGGMDLSGLKWLTVKNGVVTDIDFDAYLAYAKRQKTAPAFDSLELASPETNLFGTETVDSQHFTSFSSDNSADHTLADAGLVKMMNAMNYIGTGNATTAPHWRIRHGSVDRDTSIAVPIILATKLQNAGYDADIALPWGRGHSGDYDLDELFAWIDGICAK